MSQSHTLRFVRARFSGPGSTSAAAFRAWARACSICAAAFLCSAGAHAAGQPGQQPAEQHADQSTDQAADQPERRAAPSTAEERLARIAEQTGVPGLAAARATVAGGESNITTAATGVRVAFTPEGRAIANAQAAAVTPGDLWHIGSCTKAMTATLLATFVAEGRLSWDDTLGELLADLFEDGAAGIPAAARHATVADLLRHRAGLPANPDAAVWAKTRGVPLGDARRIIAGAGLKRASYTPGAPAEADQPAQEQPAGEAPAAERRVPGFLYSNTGYVIAGVIAERLGDAPWEDLLAERVLLPLGIDEDRYGFGPPPAGRTPASGVQAPAPQQPVGHRGGRAFWPGPFADNPAALGPAGTVHITIEAWALFTLAHTRGDDLANDERDAMGLGRADYAELHRPFAPVGPEAGRAPEPGDAYAAGWVVGYRGWAGRAAEGDNEPSGGLVLTHAGSNTMWFAVAWLAPERDLALLAVTNTGDEPAGPAATDRAVGAMMY